MDAWHISNPIIKVRGKSGKKLTMTEASRTDIEAHERLNDEWINTMILECEDPEIEPAQKILERLDRRDFYKDIFDIDITDKPEMNKKKKQQILEDIQQYVDETKGDLKKNDFAILMQTISGGIKFENVSKN